MVFALRSHDESSAVSEAGPFPPKPEASSESVESGNALVAFFRSLSPEARRQYEALADLDRRFGEDVEAEKRAMETQ